MKMDMKLEGNQSIPKIIHYCWFGKKPLSDNANKCIKSWKKYFPGYKIMQWDESNFDVDFNYYTAEAYRRKKYAFVSDVARLVIMEKYGGVYFDTDVEVIMNYDDILKRGAFLGIEKKGKLNTGLGFGAEKGNWLVKKMLDDYDGKHFFLNNKEELTPCPVINSRVAVKSGFLLHGKSLETINGFTVYPRDYFNPKSGYGEQIKITKNTHSIHHFDGSWLPKQEIHRASLKMKLSNIFGKRIGAIIYKTLFSPYLLISHIIQGVKK